jgi:hypothetical protein
MKIEIKNRYTNEVIYRCEAESIKDAIQKAIKEKVNLSNSNLRGSDLRDSDLSNSNLSNSDLSNSNLRGSDLSYSNLSGSDLRDSDLSYSNLSYSNLSNSNLRGSDLRDSNLSGSDLRDSKNLDKTIKLPMHCKWSHGITNGNLIHIGCEKRTIEEWDLFFNSDEKLSTERCTQEFKQIQAVFEAYKAYLNFLNK